MEYFQFEVFGTQFCLPVKVVQQTEIPVDGFIPFIAENSIKSSTFLDKI